MKKTFKELNKFSQTLVGLSAKDENFKNSKFAYACKRFEEINLTKPYKEYNEGLLDARIDNALTDKSTDALIRDEKSPRGFAFSKDGFKKVLKAEQAIEKKWEDKEFEVEPYICKPANIPATLTDEEIEIFKGLVI